MLLIRKKREVFKGLGGLYGECWSEPLFGDTELSKYLFPIFYSKQFSLSTHSLLSSNTIME